MSFRSVAAFLGVALLFAVSAVAATTDTPVGVSSDIERTASTTPEEKIAYAERGNQEIRDAERQMTKLLEQARKDPNGAEAVQCVVSRLTAVRALVQVSMKAEVDMKTALQTGEEERANHEYRKIAVAVSKTRVLLAEANRCLTGEQVESGTTLVDWVAALDEIADEWEDEDVEDVWLDLPPVSPSQ